MEDKIIHLSARYQILISMQSRAFLFHSIIRASLAILLLIVISFTFFSCEKDNYNPENYWPQVGHRIDMVERYWGPPDDRDSYYNGDVFIVSYYYYNEGIFIEFFQDRVDFIGDL
ncbi:MULTISPECIES: hypothetical protein [Olivibacter]|jgi:hypothetical protein|uniref:Uncharacterized protein n=1 Tax=Olivibacter oleidegradans TaxID=760123 RepID=A0ABV6HSN1_9SPHI|nr:MULTISPECIES: hypothetical protein [Olivibacter]MDM8174450.1 hypothetical protein [Olivibacter sp. 47]QEL01322.1 hypothetical protein FKG96_11025 [Olivibacter sp. LS-1]